VRTGDWATIRRIASQDVHTPASYDAIDLLGSRFLDQNRPLSALRQFQRLLNFESARQHREPYLSIRTAAAWSSLGRTSQARLALIDLSRWLERHPDIAESVPPGFVPNVSQVSEWLRQNLPPVHPMLEPETQNRFYAAGLLPQASTSVFSPTSRTLWKSLTFGFNVPVSTEDRAKFQIRFEGEDVNSEDPYPESEVEMAALVDVGLEHLARRDQRQRTVALPACEPIVVDGRVIFRTLNRIRSVDLKTGRLQWESFLTDPAFAEQFDLRRASQSINVPKESHDITNPLNQRQSAVIHSRTRVDRTAGTLSTDGKLLFTLEDGGVTAKTTAYQQPGLRETAPRSWNRLCAVDAASGILRWQIGGPEGEYKLPAAGIFFLGVPTVLDDSIYVLGEQATWIRLFCLESATGNIKWVQPVTTANVSVTDEGLRRIGGISPRAADGLIICPSLSGMIVAFDQEQQRLAWTSQYRTQMIPRAMLRPMLHRPTMVSTINLDSDERWTNDSLLVLSGRVVMAPLDSQELICLDAVSGDTLWTQPRGQGLFVGAAFENQVIVVDGSAVRSLRLSDGTSNWIVPLNQRIPTGRGLRIGSLFHLPVAIVNSDQPSPANETVIADPGSSQPEQTGRLVTIDLAVGRLLAESDSPDGLPLGNIVACDGHLLTQRFDSVVVMESLSSVESQLAKQLAMNPGDARTLESRARIRLHEGRQQEGLSDLQRAVADKNARTALDLLVEQALEQLRHGQKLTDETQQVLATAQLNALQRNAIDTVRSERLIEEKNFVDAFDLLLKTPQIHSETGVPFTVHADPLSISSKAWTAAQLRSVYKAAESAPSSPDEVVALKQRIQRLLDQARTDSDPAALRRWLASFAWHELSSEAAVALAERLDPKKDALEIDSLWTGLASHSNDAIASLAKAHQPKPAAAIVWPDAPPKVTKASHSLSADRRIMVEVAGNRSPAIQGWEFELSLRGLTAISPTGNPLWTLTDQDLRSDPILTTSRHSGSRIFSSGHLLAVSTGTEFSVFDIHESPPRRLWMRSFASLDAEGFFQMRRTHLLGSSVLISGNTPVGSVDFLNSHSLVYRTSSTLRVVDATSGETIWTRDRISPDALIFGDERALVVADVRSAHCQLFDLSSGRLIKEHFEIPLVGLLTTHGVDPIVRQNRGTSHVISRFDMRSGVPHWEHEIPGNASIRPAEQDRLIELHPDGRILVREQSTGQAIIEVQAEQQLVPGRFFLHETPSEYVLFLATPQRTFQSRIGPLNLQGAPQEKIEGPAYGIDRVTGKLLWAVNIEPQYFAASQPSQLPFVVLACWSSEPRPNGAFTPSTRSFQFRILDTRTGATLFSADEEEDVLNFLSTGDAGEMQASVTFGKTVIHFDFSDTPKKSAPPQD
jgi:outer membrane protein assembly factor BamB